MLRKSEALADSVGIIRMWLRTLPSQSPLMEQRASVTRQHTTQNCVCGVPAKCTCLTGIQVEGQDHRKGASVQPSIKAISKHVIVLGNDL